MVKQKDNKLLMYGGLIAIVLLVGTILGFVNIPILGDITGDGTSPVDTTVPPAAYDNCNTATSTTVTLAVKDLIGTSNTTLTDDYNVIPVVNGAEKPEQAAGTSLVLAPYDVVELYFVNGNATQDVYAFRATYTAPCKTSDTVVFKDGMQDTALSTTMYDVSAGSDTANVSGTAATVGAGGTAKAKMYIAATTNDGIWGSTQDGAEIAIAIDYNSLVYKQPAITSVSDGTFELQTGVPNGHTAVSGTNATAFYIIETEALRDLGDITMKFQAESLTGTTNPSTSDGNMSVTIYDKDMYQRVDGSWDNGYRNADTAADLGETNVADIFYVE